MDLYRPRAHRRLRLEPSRHLELLRQDGELLARAAVSTPVAAGSSVPGCPGWTVADVVRHTGAVHRRTVRRLRIGAAPAGTAGAPAPGGGEEGPPPGTEPVAWFREGVAELAHELASREPGAPADTWYPGDRSTAFWYRRMACETAVHRVDVQAAVRDARDPDPVDAALAADAVDEVLTVFLGGPRDAEHPLDRHYLRGRSVAVDAGGHRWRVAFGPDGAAAVHRPADGAGQDGGSGGPEGGSGAAAHTADAEVGGGASDVLLYLWGRLPGSAVRLTGDPGVLVAFRKRLAAVTA